jgi:colanic acid/amylovoran biosynthesis glycosyltransferase
MAKVAYIFTTFPKLSERFFLREVEALRAQGFEFDLCSLIGGRSESTVGPVQEMGFLGWVGLPVELLYWLSVRPRALCSILSRVLSRGYGSWTNYGENLLGVAFAVRFAREFRGRSYRCSHATWATGPGMAVWTFKQLIDLPYTLEAHAYDVFRDGGDRFLAEKLAEAQAIRSSTESTAAELRRVLADESVPVVCVRRGLTTIPEYKQPSPIGAVLHVLSVGRLIEKKGYDRQLSLFAHWLAQGVSFRASIVGEGPLWAELERKIDTLGLQGVVELTGKLNYDAVEMKYRDADLFLFSGRISASGDRDGFPNVIGEAMAASVPVFSTDVSGTTEGVHDRATGFIIDLSNEVRVAGEIEQAMADHELIVTITEQAHRWITESFCVDANVRRLKRSLWDSF